jgi:hypothetical protein
MNNILYLVACRYWFGKYIPEEKPNYGEIEIPYYLGIWKIRRRLGFLRVGGSRHSPSGCKTSSFAPLL